MGSTIFVLRNEVKNYHNTLAFISNVQGDNLSSFKFNTKTTSS
ncbi:MULTISPECIES: hypothetical protein [Brochothrix]|uniref:Uncharacterized protein n=1 Tax=Brochothrix thermosphacta TaxID=2756 RepID=A0A2X0RWV8_BROTH|nr:MULTISPECIES: hypothetical protein [Brochothrix]SLM98908.1 hypothetical protein FM106_16725 [Brachybacterium faecium]MDO7863084.1 hypothetical protein [Brochothrix thermosphacta]WKK70115.1 hypothetical protein Q0G00_05935 [Brochothrix thermosphacta]SOC29787.1 hypothetical protein BTH160X_50408 [Brochothrix thermosphacta]SPN76128.1 conserved hypothetical protein [Brochothrix thermosphacta]